MSEAPEKIRTNAAGNAIVTPHPVWDTDVEYIRADVAQAMVAKAREDALREAAEIAIDYGKQQYIANVVHQPQYADDIADDAKEIAGEILALIGKQ
jgi:hypothetical protein